MFRKQDFKKLDLLGSGIKHTKIYKVQHLVTGKIYALKEIEAKMVGFGNQPKGQIGKDPNILKRISASI